MEENKGSFTLESTIVFPVFFGMILLFIIVAVYVFQQGVLYTAAVRATESAAFHWDNSKRDATGLPPAGQDDGLYWRLGSDGLLQSLLHVGWDSSEPEAKLPLPSNGADTENLSGSKLARGGDRLSRSLTGELTYERSVLQGTIMARLYPAGRLEAPGGRKLGAAARAHPADPVEFIRSVDLVRYYTAKFRSSSDSKPDSVGKALGEYATGRK